MDKPKYRWNFINQNNKATAEQLAKEINIPYPLALALINRGVDSYQSARKYFRPQSSDLYDPFLMNGMKEAVDRIIYAIKSNERIMIFSDYDVDGANSAAMLILFLQRFTPEVKYYIPDRIKEGYGISKLGIDKAKEWGAKLCLAVDCGITAIEQVAYGKTLGIDFIICDHHEPSEQIPDAIAVLDPLKPGCNYPFKYLCGCGIALKLIQAITQQLLGNDNVMDYIDFTAIATAADIVPLIDENRTLTRLGLEKVNKNPRSGFLALMKSAGIEPGYINTGQIVFMLAPRINAVGRLGDASRAVQLLISDDMNITQSLASALEEDNQMRRRIDEITFNQAQSIINESVDIVNEPAIILHNDNWHPGVIGIVASRIVEKYYKPTIMLTTLDGVAKGSARSIPGFDIYQALKKVQNKLIQFGGHKYAAGLSVELNMIDEFRKSFNTIASEMITDDIRTPEIKIDAEITLDEINSKFIRVLKEFSPYGPGNMRPIFLARDVQCVGVPKIVGTNHLRFRVRQNQCVFNVIGFGQADSINEIQQDGQRIDIVFSIDEHDVKIANEKISIDNILQLKLKDFRTINGVR